MMQELPLRMLATVQIQTQIFKQASLGVEYRF